MDSLEFNKIAGAVLSALLLAFGAGTVSGILTGEGHGASHEAGHEGGPKPGYVLPVTGGGGEASQAAAEKPFDPAAVLAQVKTASAENGQGVFKRCAACHTSDKDGKPLVGPNLWGIVGRPIGSSPGFPRYSTAMKSKGGDWTFANLATYIHDPKAFVPGNQMAFAGVKSNDELSDLLAYLRTLSDKPAALPN